MSGSLSFEGFPRIGLAETVKGVARLDNPFAAALMDRSVPLTPQFANAIVAQSVFSWEGRHPTPALDARGNFIGTDFDLTTFLLALTDRKAVIEIPFYRNRRVRVTDPNVRYLGGGGRFGTATSLVSHQKAHSLGVRMYDSSIAVKDPVTERETLGDYRIFMFVDVNGEWHGGFRELIWDPTRAENAFLTEHGLWTDNKVLFQHAVHPNRWQSVFGAPYFLLKMLVSRIDDEIEFYGAEVERLLKLGIRFPSSGAASISQGPKTTEGPGRKVEVTALEAMLALPEFSGAYTPVPNTVEGLVEAAKWRKKLIYKVKPRAQFVIRADELAYFKYGENRIAHWMGEGDWQLFRGYRARKVWNQIALGPLVAYRQRHRTLHETVAA